MENFLLISIIVSLFVIFISYIIFRIVNTYYNRKLFETVSELDKGTESERDLVLGLLKFGVPAEDIFHDLYIQRYKNNFSQVDLVVVSKVGIMVFEVKDYSGWIFGNGKQQKWTQVLAYGQQKYYFYNPIIQNNNHILELRKQLKLSQEIPFYSIIVFYGYCELKDISFVPQGTFIATPRRVFDVVRNIIINNISVNYSDKNKILQTLSEYVKNGENIKTQTQHIENIKDMLGEHRVFK